MASGLPPVVRTRARGLSERRSKIVTAWPAPLLVAPRPKSGARATPCTPGGWGISPCSAPEGVAPQNVVSTRLVARREGESECRDGRDGVRPLHRSNNPQIWSPASSDALVSLVRLAQDAPA